MALRAARPCGAASFPRTQPLPGASYCCCHPHLSRDGEGGMWGPPRSSARGSPPLAAAGKGARAGLWAAQGGRLCQSLSPGGPEDAVTPQELGWGKAAEMVRKGWPEPPERRGGGRGCVSPTAGPRGSLCPQTCIQLLREPRENRGYCENTAWAQLAPAPGRPEMFFLTIS